MKKTVKNYLIKPHTIRLLFLSFLIFFSSVGILISVILQEYSDQVGLSQAIQAQSLSLPQISLLLIALVVITTLTLGILFLLMSVAVYKEAFLKGHEHAMMCRIVEVKK